VGPGSDGDYSFKHVLAQEAVYSTLLKGRRAAYHEAIGTAIEDLYADRLEEHAEVLARHFDEAERPDRAVPYLIMANAKAVRSNAVAEAHGYFTRAHELFQALPPTDENRAADVQLLCENVLVFQLLFLYGDYYRLLHDALPVAREIGSAELEGRVLNRMSHMEWAFGDLETSKRNAHRAVELLTTEGTGQELTYAHMIVGYDQLVAGDFEEIERSEALSLAACERGFDLRWFVWTLSFASMGYAWMGRFADAIDRGERALAVAEEYADASLVCFASWVLGIAHTIRGDVTRALPLGTRAVAVAPTPSDQSWAGATNAWFMCRAGQVEEGIVILEEAVAANRAAQFLWSEVMATYLAEGYILSGRLDEARRTLGEALDFCRPRGMRHTAAVAERLMGDALRLADVGAGRFEEARAQYEVAVEACRAIGAENELAHALEGLGRLHLDHGDPDEGRRHLEDALAIYERLGALGAPDSLRATLG
jgi:tetratricopeptide (TPR) repeat protein